MITQKWLIADPSATEEEIETLVQSNGCVGWIVGIPPRLSQLAEEEAWVLPHFWEEVVS